MEKISKNICNWATVFLAVAIYLSLATNGFAAILFFDDFNVAGSDVNRSKWTTPTGKAAFFGRTAIRNPKSANDNSGKIRVSGGVAKLLLSTYNPTAQTPGDSFWGSEIDSIRSFNLPGGRNGIEFSARVRSPIKRPKGIVTSLFGFGLTQGANSKFKDEIDFEFLSNHYQPNTQPPKVLLNRYVNEPPGRGRPELIDAPDIDFTKFNVVAIHWFPNRIDWFVNGNRIRSVSTKIPQGSLSVRLNIWAPGPTFSQAFSSELQPTSDPNASIDYVYAVDWVRVSVVKLKNDSAEVVPAINTLLLDK